MVPYIQISPGPGPEVLLRTNRKSDHSAVLFAIVDIGRRTWYPLVDLTGKERRACYPNKIIGQSWSGTVTGMYLCDLIDARGKPRRVHGA